MVETWYVLEDGTNADPIEVATDKTGKLVHKSGVAVAYRGPGVPSTRGVDPEQERAKVKPDPDPVEPGDDTATAEMKPEGPKRSYKTRESKAD